MKSNLPKRREEKPEIETFSFCGAGWYQMYHFGAAAAIRDCKIGTDKTRYVGSSAGALVASALAAKLDIEQMKSFALECGDDCRAKYLNWFKMKHYLVEAIRKFGNDLVVVNATPPTSAATSPSGSATFSQSLSTTFWETTGLTISTDCPTEEDKTKLLGRTAQERLSRQLEVYVTILPWVRKRAITRFESMEDCIEALTASCCLVPLVGFPFKLRATGEWVIDGGLASFQPRDGEPGVITVSPFYFSDADIRPSVFLPAWWGLRPPRHEDHEKIFDVAYNNAIMYFVSKNRITEDEGDRLLAKRGIKARVGDGKVYDPFKRDAKSEAKRSRFRAILGDVLVMFLFSCIVRPLAMMIVYLEMVVLSTIMGFQFMVFGLWDREERSRLFWNLYENFRNAISIRVFMRMLFQRGNTINEERLGKHNKAYRFFHLWIGPKTSSTPNSEQGTPVDSTLQ